jgi:hypothetical protein
MIAEEIATLPTGSNQYTEGLGITRPSQARVAEMMHITPDAISHGRAIKKYAPSEIQPVKAGTVSLDKAYRIALKNKTKAFEAWEKPESIPEPAPEPDPPAQATRDPALTADAVAALMQMSIPKTQARAWVNAAKGDNLADLVKDALRLRALGRSHTLACETLKAAPDVLTISEPVPVQEQEQEQEPSPVSNENAITPEENERMVNQFFEQLESTKQFLQRLKEKALKNRGIGETTVTLISKDQEFENRRLMGEIIRLLMAKPYKVLWRVESLIKYFDLPRCKTVLKEDGVYYVKLSAVNF